MTPKASTCHSPLWPSIKVADIPGGLDEKGRLVLVRRLVREGFLVADT